MASLFKHYRIEIRKWAAMFTWVNILLLILPVQVNSWVVLMFVQLNALVLVLVLSVLINKLVLVNFVQVKPLVLLMFMQIYPSMVVKFVHKNLLMLAMLVQVKLLELVMLVQGIPLVLFQQYLSVLKIFCSGKPVCRNNVRSSKPVEVIFFQSKFANVNILPCKPVLAGKGNIKNSSWLNIWWINTMWYLSC